MEKLPSDFDIKTYLAVQYLLATTKEKAFYMKRKKKSSTLLSFK
jgi:hypothetical protein